MARKITREVLEERFDAAVGNLKAEGQVWEPNEIGETLAWAILKVVVRTAPSRSWGLRAYKAMERGSLDNIMDALRDSIVAEVAAAR